MNNIHDLLEIVKWRAVGRLEEHNKLLKCLDLVTASVGEWRRSMKTMTRLTNIKSTNRPSKPVLISRRNRTLNVTQLQGEFATEWLLSNEHINLIYHVWEFQKDDSFTSFGVNKVHEITYKLPGKGHNFTSTSIV